MTVKSINTVQKNTICSWYSGKLRNQKELATEFNTSERTINRVLIEAGLLTPVAQLKADAYNVMQVLKKHGIDPSKLDQVLTAAYRPAPPTQESVAEYLYDAKREEITELFYTAMMNRALDSQLALSYPQTELPGNPVYAAEGFDDLPF